MRTIYFDNAATSWPKPPGVCVALADYLGDAGGNPGRSGHRMSVAAARSVDLPLITRDGDIRASGAVKVLW